MLPRRAPLPRNALAIVDFAQRRITVNLVYFGPRKAGSGTNVRQLHRVQPAREKAELRKHGMADRKERIWQFTYRPPEVPRVPGFDVAVRVCSVPSHEGYDPEGDEMMEGVDGICFVADARANRVEDNLTALHNLEYAVTRLGLDLGAIPMVYQVNQTDAANARPTERVMEELNPFGLPVFPAMARQGKGVLETHEALLMATATRLKDNLSSQAASVTLTALSRARREADEGAILDHVATLGRPNVDASGTPRSALQLDTAAEIYVRPPALRESRPVHLVRAELEGPRIRVEAIVRRKDSSSRKLAFMLEAGGPPEPPPSDPMMSASEAAELSPTGPPYGGGFSMEREHDDDLPALYYGLGGVVSGLISGFLLRYILFG